jgi:hypothetical protein
MDQNLATEDMRIHVETPISYFEFKPKANRFSAQIIISVTCFYKYKYNILF